MIRLFSFWESLFPGNVLFVSPHPDDVALSLGGVLRPGELASGSTILSVFTRTNFYDNGNVCRGMPEVTKIRISEDKAYASWLKVSYRECGLNDAVCRYDSVKGWRRAPVSGEFEYACRTFHKNAESIDFDIVIGPSGIGGHVDHLICRKLATELSVSRQVPCYLYEDFPYALDAGEIGGIWAAIAFDFQTWELANNHYPSQRRTWRSAEVKRRCEHMGKQFDTPVIRLFSVIRSL